MAALDGIDVLWRYRFTEEEGNEAAWGLAYTTESGYSKSKSSETTITKDGTVVTPGAVETTASATTLYKVGDTRIDELEEKGIDAGKRMQLWRISTKEAGTGENASKYKAKYFEGYLTTFEPTDNAEDKVEYSLEWSIESTGKNGYATLVIDDSDGGDYAFKDTVKVEATP